MARYAYVVAGVVQECVSPLDGFALADCYSAEFVAACEPCGDDVLPGWTMAGASGAWAFAEPVPVVVTIGPELIAGLAFVMTLFTADEQAKVIALLTTDGRVTWFMHLLGLAGSVALTNPMVIKGVDLLASLGAIASARIPQILAGITADAVAFDPANAVLLT